MNHNNSTIEFGGTFAFLHTHKAKQKNAKEPPTQRTTSPKNSAILTRQTSLDREARTANMGLAKKRVQWLIEYSTSHQHLWWLDSFVLRNPLLRQAQKR
jgi:hypothetical protein